MREDEIKKGIQLVCDTSKEISKLYEDKNALVEKLNSLSNEDLAPLNYEYRSKSGPVTDLRKDVLKYLLDGNKLDERTFDEFILKRRTGQEDKFIAFQKPFSIFHPFVTSYGHKPFRGFVEQFIDEIIERLQLKGKVKHKFVDFQGARYLGTDRSWLAIYNSKHKSQTTALQLFVDFQNGKIKYGVYRYPEVYVKGPEEKNSSNFDFEALISLFEENKESILKDEPQEDILTIPLAGSKLYKMSHGEFKTNKYANVLDIFKQKHWIVLHESTAKGQAEKFKNKLHVGDYLYITVGGDELFEVAKVSSGSWEYVPEDIINESGWLYREVEYIRSATKPDPSDLKNYKEYIYPSGNSTLTEISPQKLDDANNRIFKPHFSVEFVSDETEPTRENENEVNVLDKFPCNIILYGPPGTGKTYYTIDLAVEIITGNNVSHEENKEVFDALRKDGQIEFITFHQNYSYEDFMIGIRPDLNEASTLKFQRKEGIFYRICKRAEHNYLQSQNQKEITLKRYVLIIDEINRANISKVFGELITLLEEDKRLGAKNELRLSIPGEDTDFGIPPNIYVIGTMNTADKSIAMIDIALRRRFEFQGYFPDYSKVDRFSGDILRHINNEIYKRKKSADYLIGHGYFMNGDEPPETSKVLENKVIPLLMEYFSGKTEVVEEIFNGSKWSVKYDTEKYCWEIKQ
ncbi:McrB family protein [Methanosarcina sp. T3]|uniref:McrB family protein n=1 Tax=Methanosarcina sp. T3 TaxID=3439062 RepID=UPI003F859DD3